MRALLAALLAAALSVSAAADVFLVRHAEKKNPKDPQSLLSRKGRARAEALRRVLSSADLKAVYCTEFERTLQTAAPTAAAHGLKPIRTSSEDVAGLVKLLRARPASEDVLVVGHSDTIPDILAGLGVSTRVGVGATDYDNLFLIVPRAAGAPGFHHLHYGD